MPHHICAVSTCQTRIPSTTKKLRKLSEPLLYAQMLETGRNLNYGDVICESCRNEIVRDYSSIIPILEAEAIVNDKECDCESSSLNDVSEMLEQLSQISAEYPASHQIERLEDFCIGVNDDSGNDLQHCKEVSTTKEHRNYLNPQNNLLKIANDYGDSTDEMDFSNNTEGLDLIEELHDYDQYEEGLITPPDVDSDPEYELDNEEESEFPDDSQIIQAEACYSESGSSLYDMLSEEFSNNNQSSPPTPTPRRRKCRRMIKDQKIVVDDVLSVAVSQSRCFVCRHQNTKRNRVPENAILELWIKHRVLVPRDRVRCCQEHLKSDETFTDDAVTRIILHAEKGASLTPGELGVWLNRLADRVNSKSSVLDFDSDSLRDEDYKLLTGLYKDKFDNLLSYIEPYLYKTKHRSPRNALAIFLILLRLSVSQKFISYLFGLPVQRVNVTITRVTTLLAYHFVPRYLGYNHISRDEAMAHVPEFVRELYAISEENLALLYDATYLYIQKPQDLKSQRETYSMQKKRNLVKPMMVILPDGYILEAEGMYKANTKNNDAGILLHMLDKNNGLASFIKEGDHCIVDRGFRDAVRELKKRKMYIQMPELLKGARQFTTQQANNSRKVTLTRWAIEAVNGRIKHVFKFFDNVIYNSYIFDNKLNKMFRIACAILNAYYTPLYQDQPKHKKILDGVKERINKKNALKGEVEKKGWDKKKDPKWIKATSANFLEFPRMSETDIFDLTLGIWQTKNAILYTKQHIQEDPEYSILVHSEEPYIVRAQIHSRFHTSDYHKLWIKFDLSENGNRKISGHYCRCKNGARSMGLCSHLTSVIWYLGFFRHQSKAIMKKSFCSILLDAAEKTMERESEPAKQ